MPGNQSFDNIPDYRKLYTESYGNFLGFAWSRRNNVPIPSSCIPEKYREVVNIQYCCEAISSYFSLVQNKDGLEFINMAWPADYISKFGSEIIEGMACVTAWRSITVSKIVALIDTVRNRILNFALEIQSEAPEAGDVSLEQLSIQPERIQQVFNTYVMGNVGHMVAGDQTISHDTSIIVINNDFDSLKEYLATIGIEEGDIQELKHAITEDKGKGRDQGFGEQVQAWFGKIVNKAGTTALDLSKIIAAQLILQALNAFYGFPS